MYIAPGVGGIQVNSGAVASGALAPGTVVSGVVASGAIMGSLGGGPFNIASGTLGPNDLASGSIQSGQIASGQVGPFKLSSGAVQSGNINSGNIITFARVSLDDSRFAGQAISGVISVAIGSGGNYWVPAERQSGLRMPALGVNITNALSGAAISVVTQGFVPDGASGTCASGAGGGVYVGSGGLIVNLSGFCGGASSGPGVGSFSGSLIQMVGVRLSGGVFVAPESSPWLATISGAYLSCLSGQFPVSGFGTTVF